MTDEEMKLLVEATAAAGISTEEAAAAIRNVCVPVPVPEPPDRMTFEEVLIFCDKRRVKISTNYDPFPGSYTIKMRKGRKVNSVSIALDFILNAKYFPARSTLTRMADELDAMPPEP